MSQGLDSDRVAYWAEIVRQYRKSGLSQPEFCQRRGLTLGSLKNWLYKVPYRQAVDRFLEQRQGGPSGPTAPKTPEASTRPRPCRFVPVTLTTPRPATVGVEDARGAAVVLEVRLGSGRRIAVAPGFDADTLKRLLDVLEERP
jgi:hypothetical protein